MPCFHPLAAWKVADGSIYFGAERPERKTRGLASRPLTLPCGQCVGCRLERSRQWAIRCMHEASLHASNSFVTLTYDSNNCGVSLEYDDFRLFIRRLRHSIRVANVGGASIEASVTRPTCESSSTGRVRFFVAGEYGDRFLRPHFHCLLFGKSFPDRYPWRKSGSGFQLYRSAELEKLWPAGIAEVGDVSFESAAYVARYCMKKVTGDGAKEHYRRVDWRTGEWVDVRPEFCRMSLRPGIGSDWIRLYRSDVYRGDGDAYVVVNGMKMKPPRYYDQYMSETLELDHVKAVRGEKAMLRRDDQTPERLAVQEVVTKARLSFKKRTLE